MESPKTCANSQNSGFTLIEMMVVFGLLAIIGGLGLVMSMDDYRGYSFRDERDSMVAALQRARSLAISNVCLGAGCADGMPHGVHFEEGKYAVFQGSSYDPVDAQNQFFQSNFNGMVVSGADTVIFSPLSGQAVPASLTISDPAGHSSIITINGEGQITWTN